MSNARVRIGVVGLGYWGPNLVRNVTASTCAELCWMCDLRSDQLAHFQARNPTVRVTQDMAEMLADPELEAVMIATPVSTHAEFALAALDAGKHVFVEKPMAPSAREAQEMLERAEQRGLVLLPGHTFLYSPPVVKIKDLIDNGELGDIYFISMSRVNLGLHQSDVSVVWDLGPHDLSILRYWLDAMPIEATALTRDCVFPGTPDVAFVNLRFQTGAIAHLELSWLSPSKLRRTAIVGSEKMVVYDDTSIEPVRIFDSGAELKQPETFGEFRLTYRTGDILSPRIDTEEPLAIELRDFCSAVRNGTPARVSPQLGLDVIRIIESIDESLTRGGSLVSIGE